MRKQAQATLFLILAVLLVMGAGILFYASGSVDSFIETEVSEQEALNNLEKDINLYIESCLSSVAAPLIEKISLKGGSLSPDSDVYHNREELTVFCYDSTKLGCVNTIVTREDIENELVNSINNQIVSCLELDAFFTRGLELTSSAYNLSLDIRRDDAYVVLHYPMNLRIGDLSKPRSFFSATISFPLGRLYAAAHDIANREISDGFLDVTEWMLNHGFEILVEKKKPYPNIIYILTKPNQANNKNYTFQFAIKGMDSAGTALKRIPEPGFGCCINSNDAMCFKNSPRDSCEGGYVADTDCTCPELTETLTTGCCITDTSCSSSTELQCNGNFILGDIGCESCESNDCETTYSPDANAPGPKRQHGESWCMYDSIVGFGFDYVGTRHYRHSCVNGEEIIEECRDFREEVCVENGRNAPNTNALCRPNRWQDCSLQLGAETCLDTEIRDCYWADQLLLNRQSQCVPMVPPGFKFWEGNGDQVCQYASENPTDYQRFSRPKTWGHSTALYCQKMGDCGNYRNVVDEVTRFGYKNLQGEAEDWIYNDPGFTERGHIFELNLPYNIFEYLEPTAAQDSVITYYDPQIDMPQQSELILPQWRATGNFASCSLWQAPNRDDRCNECSAQGKVCSEYRCKSLGRLCSFTNEGGIPSCVASGTVDTNKPEITFDSGKLSYGYDADISQNTYYGGLEHTITPNVNPYFPLSLGFSTSKPSRCMISLRPPTVPSDIWLQNSLLSALPQTYLSNEYKNDHDVTIRFPDRTLNNLTQFLLFLSCEDNLGNRNDDEVFFNINMKDPAVTVLPKIVRFESRVSGANEEFKELTFYANKPFKQCRYATSDIPFGSMNNSLGCNTTVFDMNFFPDTPLGSFRCSQIIPFNESSIFMNCKDWFDNTALENFEYSVG